MEPLRIDPSYYQSYSDSTSLLADAIQEVGPSPCQKFNCDKWSQCASEKVECKAFRVWTNMGKGVYERHLVLKSDGTPREKPIENSMGILLQPIK